MTFNTMTDRVRDLIERPVSPDELRRALQRPIGEDEREEILALVRWFRRRYSTGADRLAYVRRAYARWKLIQPAAKP